MAVYSSHGRISLGFRRTDVVHFFGFKDVLATSGGNDMGFDFQLGGFLLAIYSNHRLGMS